MASIARLVDAGVVRVWLACTSVALLAAGIGAVAIDDPVAPPEMTVVVDRAERAP